ncbi:hypothetical protein NYQ35_15015 [Curtobacterium flaccumfaciens pv. flaccumfaciens]|uniref:hypothetical protein n=1 Tax=Curtobacterium flaccumfaciens TaxID=2035 RepID=UPI00217DC8A1|nr:hypothetical protein [Curtobacterium flaccumfaciens]MCS6570115.1 hypothetical protein [Curtobacterium flaccumfaciens pv. flaccumfaciens]MCS6585912.1 hypothetical protein [Curtobacterium flaccumfaciens pv. flaccumfaciens]
MEQHTDQRTRPRVVTIAVALWWASVVISLVAAAPGMVVSMREAGGAIIGASLGLVIVLAWSALFLWLATRMGRGSGNARLWLAIIAGLSACSTVFAIATDGVDWSFIEAVCVVVAAVLSYLPSARPFFPRDERRPRSAEPRTIGWDPTTGERIFETPPSGDRAN